MSRAYYRHCHQYDKDVIQEHLEDIIQELGGLEAFFSPGQTILLKVNMLMKKKPEEAVTTNPVFLAALTRLLHNFGVKVVIADSPGGPFTEHSLEKMYRVCGFYEVAQETGARLNYNVSSFEKDNPNGFLLKRVTLIEVLKEVDHVISVAKLKTHSLTRYTGAVKNMFGTVPGLLKAEYHVKMPKIYDFTNMLIDICLASNPTLSFIDGIVAMEGPGPSAGTPVDLGVIIGSDSAFQADYLGVQLIGLQPQEVPTVASSMERGYVTTRALVSPVKSLDVPPLGGEGFLEKKMPKPIAAIVESALKPKPIFMHQECIGCGDCARSCPNQAIEMKSGKPYVTLEKCIRCFCCQELCPVKAVKVHRNWLLRKMVKL